MKNRPLFTDSVQKRVPVTAGPGNGQGRKSKWNHSPTTAIRVPMGIASHLLAVAKDWDEGEDQSNANEPSFLYKNSSSLTTPEGNSAVKRPALRYYGAKWRLAKWIIKHLPPHLCYCEPYSGSAAVLLQKRPAEYEVYNDLDTNVTTFFRVLRDRTEELIRAIALTPYARTEQKLSYQGTEDELEKARRFYVRCWQGYAGGAQRQTGWRYLFRNSRSQTVIDDWNKFESLWSIADRLRQVQIECDDALKVLRRYDTPETLFLVDPPYLQSTRGSSARETYFFEMSDEQHKELAEYLNSLEGMSIICGFPSPLYENLYQGWQCVSTQSQMITGKLATECLWISPSAWDRFNLHQSAAQLQLFTSVI